MGIGESGKYERELKAKLEKIADGSLVIVRQRTCHPIILSAGLELHVVGFLDKRNCDNEYLALNHTKPATNAPNNAVFEAATYPQIRISYSEVITYRKIKD